MLSFVEVLPTYVSFGLGFIPFVIVYVGMYGSPGTKRYFDRDPEIVIREYVFISRVLFIEIGFLIVITILFYLLPEPLKKTSLWPLFGDGFYFVQTTLTYMIYSIIIVFFRSYLNRDFRFSLAKRCMYVARKEENQVKKIHYLIIGLIQYNKYLKRNLNVQFDDVRVYSNIISSSSDKKQIVKTIAASFEDDNDKLKPTNSLSTFSNLEPKEQFLVKKSLSTKIKEVGTFLAAIIPVLITILQLMFPQYFQNLANK